jgi:hypothetical protein
MPSRKKRISGNQAPDHTPDYLTKRILISASRAAGKKAEINAMKLMGYTVVVHDGWLVNKFQDGHMEKIEQIGSTANQKIVIDE